MEGLPTSWHKLSSEQIKPAAGIYEAITNQLVHLISRVENTHPADKPTSWYILLTEKLHGVTTDQLAHPTNRAENTQPAEKPTSWYILPTEKLHGVITSQPSREHPPSREANQLALISLQPRSIME